MCNSYRDGASNKRSASISQQFRKLNRGLLLDAKPNVAIPIDFTPMQARAWR